MIYEKNTRPGALLRRVLVYFFIGRPVSLSISGTEVVMISSELKITISISGVIYFSFIAVSPYLVN